MNTHLRIGVVGGTAMSTKTAIAQALMHETSVVVSGSPCRTAESYLDDVTGIHVLTYDNLPTPVIDLKPKSKEPFYRSLPKFKRRK